MKIKSYTRDNDCIKVILGNEDEELHFKNSNGEWELESYFKRNNDERVFDIIVLSKGENGACQIKYSANDFFRVLQYTSKGVLSDELITGIDPRTNETVTYLKRNGKIYFCSTGKKDDYNTIFAKEINISEKEFLKYFQYEEEYSKILSQVTESFKADLKELDSPSLNK